METLAARIRDLRTQRGLGLRGFARQAGIAPSYVVAIEAGERMPSADVLGRIAVALEVPLVELQVLDPRLPGTDGALWLAVNRDWDGLLDCLAGLEDGYLERLAEGAGELRDAAGEVLGRRRS